MNYARPVWPILGGIRVHQNPPQDYGHFVYQSRPPAEADILLPHTSHLHARGGASGKLQSTMKENRIPFPAIRDALQRRNYPGWICLEYVWVDWEGCNRTDNVAETVLLRDLLCRG